MKRGIILLAFLMAGCGGATGGNISGTPAQNDWNVQVIHTADGTETISTPTSVLDTYTVGMDPLPSDPKTYYFAIDAINQVFGYEIIIPVDFADADIQVTQEPLDGGKMGLSYVYDGPECNVLLDPDGAEQWKIVAHELMHCLGFGHSTVWESLMHPNNADGNFTDQMLPLWEDTYKAQVLDPMNKNLGITPLGSEPVLFVD